MFSAAPPCPCSFDLEHPLVMIFDATDGTVCQWEMGGRTGRNLHIDLVGGIPADHVHHGQSAAGVFVQPAIEPEHSSVRDHDDVAVRDEALDRSGREELIAGHGDSVAAERGWEMCRDGAVGMSGCGSGQSTGTDEEGKGRESVRHRSGRDEGRKDCQERVWRSVRREEGASERG